ncbi:MAG TPA: hypothetical protein VKA26_14225 [Ignavibacteriaceae bacterium]|nr:hypothetical protein [Ignavibacteriaceae bacterium]
MSKKFLLITILFTVASLNSDFAQDKGFGIGVIIGQPTGLSGKYWVNNLNGFDFGLGFSFSKDDKNIHIHSDYLWHTNTSIESDEKFTLYYGPGLKLKTGKKNDASLGIRGVLGLAWMSGNIPVDVFIEIAPIFNFVPGTSLRIDAGFGIRYYFN